MKQHPKFWQWPNMLAIDAAVIAVLWQKALTHALGLTLLTSVYVVLGLSVWLSYAADHLYDVHSRKNANLLSLRHQFTKRHARLLWVAWFGVLGLDLLLSAQLTAPQLKHGLLLFALCLGYTLLNQKLSRRFFPKEICVALIYAGGVVVFLPKTVPLIFFGAFSCVCLLNCLVIGAKEKRIDSKLQVRAVASLVREHWLAPLAFLAAGLTLWSGAYLAWALATCFGLLGLLHILRKQIAVETFRVWADAVLLIPPLLLLGMGFHF